MSHEDLVSRVAVLEALVSALGPTTAQVLQAGVRVEAVAENVSELRQDLKRSEDVMHESIRRVETRVGDALVKFEASCQRETARVEKACTQLAKRLDDQDDDRKHDRTARLSSRAVIIAATISGTAAIIAGVVLKVLG